MRASPDRDLLLADALDAVPTPMALLDVTCLPEVRYLRVNRALTELTGVEEDAVVGRDLADVYRGRQSLLPLMTHLSEAVESGVPVQRSYEIETARGPIWFEAIATPVRQGGRRLILWVGHDIREKREVEARLRYHADLLDRVADAIISCGMDGTIRHWNAAATALYGWTAEEAVGRNFLTLFGTRIADGRTIGEVLDELLATGSFRGKVYEVDRRGRPLAIRTAISLTRDEAGEPVEIVAVNRDITELHLASEALRFQASHDPLTGLANRPAALERLQALLDAGQQAAVVFLDLDNFKLINDTLGHAAGDTVLVETAARLRSIVREGDLVARFGGDEFVIVTDREEGVEALAARVAEEVARPLTSAGTPVTVTTSVGFSHATLCSTPTDLLQEADTALYESKRRGRARCTPFDAQLRARAERELRLVEGIRKIVAERAVNLAYEAIVDLDTGDIIGTEALLRYEDPHLGPVPAPEVVAAAEDAALIDDLGRLILTEACAQATRWRHAGDGRGLNLSVNVSSSQLLAPGFTASVFDVLAFTGLPAAALVIEVTESTLITNVTRARHALQELRSAGVRVAIDDFGTGYSSLGQLDSLPADWIKLDRSLIASIAERPDAPIVRAVVALVQALGLALVVEGVETQQQRRALLDLGVHWAQGYLYASLARYGRSELPSPPLAPAVA